MEVFFYTVVAFGTSSPEMVVSLQTGFQRVRWEGTLLLALYVAYVGWLPAHEGPVR